MLRKIWANYMDFKERTVTHIYRPIRSIRRIHEEYLAKRNHLERKGRPIAGPKDFK